MTALCVCGCGQELTGKKVKFATRQCAHRVIYQRHKEASRARRQARRAAVILASQGHGRCENLRRGGACWLYAEGCASAKARGKCTYVAPVPSVSVVMALPPGRVRTSAIQHDMVCDICGAAFRGRTGSRFCSNRCRCRSYYLGRRIRDGRSTEYGKLPAERVNDGKRRCLWCQVEIDGPEKKKTCGPVCMDRVYRHNRGVSYSSGVMKELLS